MGGLPLAVDFADTVRLIETDVDGLSECVRGSVRVDWRVAVFEGSAVRVDSRVGVITSGSMGASIRAHTESLPIALPHAGALLMGWSR